MDVKKNKAGLGNSASDDFEAGDNAERSDLLNPESSPTSDSGEWNRKGAIASPGDPPKQGASGFITEDVKKESKEEKQERKQTSSPRKLIS
jgi:hypothetical protein